MDRPCNPQSRATGETERRVAGHLFDLDAGNEVEDRSLLSGDECARTDRFAFARDRIRFVAGRARLRRTLGAWTGTAPAALCFRYSPEGRPFLEGFAAPVDFNLSHSGGTGLLVVMDAGPVGVDVELHCTLDDLPGMAAQVMHAAELADFLALAESWRLAAFYRLWARKEALLKAIGLGFSAEPRRYLVGIGELPAPTPFTIDGVRCLIRDLAVGDGIAAALCAPAGSSLYWDAPCGS